METSIKNTPASSSESKKSFLIFLIYIAFIGAFSSLVNDLYLPSIPMMRREFHTTPSMTQLGLSAVMLGLGIGSMIWGSLSDRYGRKPILLYSLGLFVVSTTTSIFSPTIWFFIVCRLFQGIGAGGAMVLSFSIPTDHYDGRELAKVMALIGAINGIAPAGAPLVGGFMADSVGWRGIFVLLLVIGIFMFFWTIKRPESLPKSNRIQVTGLKTYIAAYITLLRNRRFMIYVLLKSIGIGMLYAYISATPFIFQEHYGFSASAFGLFLGGNAIAIAIGSTLVMKFKVLKKGMVTGTVIMSLFMIAEAAVLYLDGGVIWFELAAIPMLLGGGMLFSSANSLSMEVGRGDAGTSSAILNVVKYIFAAVVAPLVGLGDIMHSTAICLVGIALISVVFVIAAARLKPLATMVKS